jgi:integrase
MASIFQHEGRWQARFKDARGKWTSRTCGGADAATAKRWAAAWEAEARDTREGRIDPRDKGYREAAAHPLAEHVADFGAMLAAKGDTPGHVALALAHVRRVVVIIGAEHLADLSADAVRKAVAGIRDEGLALRTCNAILRSVKTFAGWLEADGRIRHNDLRAVGGYKADTDRRRIRRDVSDDELGRIIAAAQSGPASFGMSGADRAMAYRLAAGTGFRRNELASMTRASFALEGDAPTVRVAAGYSKRRRADEQPIDRVLAAALAGWLAGKAEGLRVLPLPRKTAEMLRGDMRRARGRWIMEATDREERRKRWESDYLAAADGEGRQFDFHALRHAFISRVVQSGASVKVCQELARHSTPVLTLGRYAHVRLADLRKAVPTIPTGTSTAEPMAMRPTGTDDSTPNRTEGETGATRAQQTAREMVRGRAESCDEGGKLRLAGGEGFASIHAGNDKTPRHGAGSFTREGDGVRTRNHRIDNPVL